MSIEYHIHELEQRMSKLESKTQWNFFWNLTAIVILGAGAINLVKDLWHWMFG